MAPGSREVQAHLDKGAQRSISTETRRLDTTDWVRRDYAIALLGDAFDLGFAEAVCPWSGDSGAAMCDW
jgi:hypothetical protein